MAEFKVIYLWEWGHRLLARLVGLVCVVPFLIFWSMKKLSKSIIKRSILISILIGIQGYIGWYMVQSGLTERVDVSQYRLTVHLCMAFIIIYNTLMLLFEVSNIQLSKKDGLRPLWSLMFLIIVFVQIFSGGLMSGLDAGLIYPTWPFMGLSIVPSDYWIPSIEVLNLFENRSNVQFNHRTLGYIVFITGLVNVYFSRKNEFILKVSLLILLLIFIQIVLGIFTIILMVPWQTAILHQFFSLLVFSFVVFSLYLSRQGK
jgi:cytochrome c oxidase assembly protein subunit 15